MNLTDDGAPDYAFRRRSTLPRDELLQVIADLEPRYQKLFRTLRLRPTEDEDQYRRSTSGLYRLIRDHPVAKDKTTSEVSRIYTDVVSILGGLL